jgi:hypothetical protein
MKHQKSKQMHARFKKKKKKKKKNLFEEGSDFFLKKSNFCLFTYQAWIYLT